VGKTVIKKNNEKLIAQQKTELDKLRDSLPLDTLRAAEDKLLAQCMENVEGLLDFSVLGFDSAGNVDEDGLPFEWGLLTPEQKARKLRLAKYACLPASEVPYGARLSHETLVGILKARAKESSGTKILNLEVSTFPAPAPLKPGDDAIDAEFEVVDLE